MKLANQTPKKTPDKRSVFQRLSIPLALLVLLSLLTPSFQPATAQAPETPDVINANWTVQVVDAPWKFSEMRDRSMRFDASGYPHIAFGGQNLYYARWNPSTNSWFTTVVDPNPNVGLYASIALDSFGNPRIAYFDETNGDLKFAYSQNGGYAWYTPMTVATLGPQPVVVPDADNPTIEEVMQKNLSDRLNESTGIGSTDSGQAVQETGVGFYTSIAIDANNQVHISYYDWNRAALVYTRWNGVVWSSTIVDDSTSIDKYDVGKYSSIALDSNGLAHISYLDEKYDELKYAYDTGNGWVLKEIQGDIFHQAPNYRFGGYTSIVLDGDGNPYISNMDWQNMRLMIASPAIGGTCNSPNCWVCGPSDSWQCRVIDDASDTGYYTSIGINSDGKLMISYYEGGNAGDLRYAESSNGRSWSRSTLDSNGYTGLYSSLSVDGYGNPGMSYFNVSTGTLLWVHYWNGGWTYGSIASMAKLNGLTSLAISTSNVPYISYFNDVGDQLKLATKSSTGWSTYVLRGDASGFTSAKTTQSGDPRIAFYSVAAGDLIYGYRTGGVWYYQTIDSGGNVGQYPSLALDPQDRPYISYYDATNGYLKFAYWNGTAWVIQVVDNTANVGLWSSVTLSKNSGNCYTVIPSNGVCAFISYYDATHYDLKFAFMTLTNSWYGFPVDTSGGVGQYTSIGLDYSGNMHISYYDETNGRLKHAKGNMSGGNTWSWPTLEVIDSSANVGKFTSLAIDTANTVNIAYYDVTNGNLKYIANTGGLWNTPQVVDGNTSPNTDVGIGASLALFSNGQPGISYYDATNERLKFATVYTGMNSIYGIPYYLPMVAR